MTRSNSRRFVNAAWSLLAFQLIAAVGAVAVTGWAAFHVQTITSGTADAQPEPATPMRPYGDDTIDGAQQRPQQGEPAPQAPDPPQPAPSPEQAQQQTPQVSPCPRDGYEIRVDANAGWCDTQIMLQQGQGVAVEARGRWSNAGDPQYGPGGISNYRHPGTIVADASLGALIARVGNTTFAIGASNGFTSPASGPLYLSINDVPGTFDDNRGWLVITVGAPQIIQ